MQRSWEAISRILRVALWDDHSGIDSEFFTKLTIDEWFNIHALSVKQGVCAMLLDGIISGNVELPRAAKMRFISSTDKVEKGYDKRRKVLVSLAKLYSKHGIDTMILKGLGLSLLYPKPSHRPSSDIDIYLFGKQREADELLQKDYNIAIDKGRHHHTVFHIKGTMVENHFDFIESNSRLSAKKIERFLKEETHNIAPVAIDIEGQRLYTPSPNMNALFLIIHTGLHFAAENISIRHLTDWAMFLNRYGKEVDWEKIYHLADDCGFAPFLAMLNSLCIYYIGMPEALAKSTTSDHELLDRVLADVMMYKVLTLPKNFFKGWVFRIRRRFANRWKQRLVFNDNEIGSLLRSAAVHIIPPSLWKR